MSDSPSDSPSRAKSPLVLVVDDFEDNRAMYAEYLRHSGFRVIEAENGLDAVERAREFLPDVVVMDLSLPVMDGWEATRQLKGDARTRAIPVIALTGHALEGHSQGARKAGCDEFLAKPCLPKTLLEKVRSMLQGGASPPSKEPKRKESKRWQADGDPQSPGASDPSKAQRKARR
jgi:two-component system cell cycle response regulator DivK